MITSGSFGGGGGMSGEAPDAAPRDGPAADAAAPLEDAGRAVATDVGSTACCGDVRCEVPGLFGARATLSAAVSTGGSTRSTDDVASVGTVADIAGPKAAGAAATAAGPAPTAGDAAGKVIASALEAAVAASSTCPRIRFGA